MQQDEDVPHRKQCDAERHTERKCEEKAALNPARHPFAIARANRLRHDRIEHHQGA